MKYLPYAEQSSANGSYKTAARTNQTNYYRVGGGWDAAVVKTSHPYAVTIFENSPLNRVLQEGAPGTAWQPEANRDAVAAASPAGHTLVTEYDTNVQNEVRLWTMNSAENGADGTAYYQPGRLYKMLAKDENWVAAHGKAGTVEEFTDFDDRVVLKRVWESNTKSLNIMFMMILETYVT